MSHLLNETRLAHIWHIRHMLHAAASRPQMPPSQSHLYIVFAGYWSCTPLSAIPLAFSIGATRVEEYMPPTWIFAQALESHQTRRVCASKCLYVRRMCARLNWYVRQLVRRMCHWFCYHFGELCMCQGMGERMCGMCAAFNIVCA